MIDATKTNFESFPEGHRRSNGYEFNGAFAVFFVAAGLTRRFLAALLARSGADAIDAHTAWQSAEGRPQRALLRQQSRARPLQSERLA